MIQRKKDGIIVLIVENHYTNKTRISIWQIGGNVLKEDYNGDLYDVYYRDGNGENQCVCYFGYSKRDAERLFNSEKCVGEEIIEIKKCK